MVAARNSSSATYGLGLARSFAEGNASADSRAKTPEDDSAELVGGQMHSVEKFTSELSGQGHWMPQSP